MNFASIFSQVWFNGFLAVLFGSAIFFFVLSLKKSFHQRFPKLFFASFGTFFLIVGAGVSYNYIGNSAQSHGEVRPGLILSNNEELAKFTELNRSGGTYFSSGDLITGPNRTLKIKNNSVDSGDIENKTIQNEDISKNAITSRTIKNGSITAADIKSSSENGFLKNDDGELSWSPVVLMDISIPKIGNPSVMDDLGKAFDYMWSAGVLSGGDITDNHDGSVNISGGEAMLRTSSSDIAPLKSLVFSGKDNIFMVDNHTNYLWVNYNGGNPVVETSITITDFNCLDKCHLYTIVREGNELAILDGRQQNIDSNRKLRRKNYETDPFAHVMGGSVLGNIDSYLTVSAGAFYYSLEKLTHSSIDTSLPGIADDRVFEEYYQDGSGGWNEEENEKIVHSEYYDDGSGTLAIVEDGFYSVRWVYMLMGMQPKLALVYGRGQYLYITDAKSEATPSNLPPSVQGAGFLIGRVITLKGDVPALVESAFSSSFTGNTNGSSNHSGLVGLSDDDHLQYALLVGRSGGQALIGGTAPDDFLKIQGTSGDGTLIAPAIQALVGNNGDNPALTILNNGNIGIGTTDPGIYKLYINGTGYLNDAGWTYASDRRLKENIKSLDSGSLTIIEKLRPVNFDYINGRKEQFGFIAQEVEEILPELVEKRPDGMLGLRTDSLLPIAIKAIQEQQVEIEELQKKDKMIKFLEERIIELEKAVSDLQKK